MFRYDAVQKGRYREHYQFGAEAIGSDDPAVDAELIGLQRRWYERRRRDRPAAALNSIGDGKCRPAYLELLVGFLDAHADELCDECRERRDVNPLRVFDCKEQGCRAIMATRPRSPTTSATSARPTSPTSAPTSTHAMSPTPSIRASCAGSTTTRAPRGSGSGPSSARSPRSRGGGRYDGLAEQLGGRPTPGVGFGAGVERLVLTLEETGAGPALGRSLDALFAVLADAARPRIHAAMDDVRAAGMSLRRCVRRAAPQAGARAGRQARHPDRRDRRRGRVGGRRGDGARYDYR